MKPINFFQTWVLFIKLPLLYNGYTEPVVQEGLAILDATEDELSIAGLFYGYLYL